MLPTFSRSTSRTSAGVANTDELKAAVAACPDLKLSWTADGILEALLVSSDDADAQQDGAFTISLLAPDCSDARIVVPQGNGSYKLAP